MNTEDKSAYNKGYVAGLLSGSRVWTRGGNEVSDLLQYIDLALEFAHAATTKLPD